MKWIKIGKKTRAPLVNKMCISLTWGHRLDIFHFKYHQIIIDSEITCILKISRSCAQSTDIAIT